MGKKILIAVANCTYSERAVKYVTHISRAAKDITYAIFNVQPLLPQIVTERAKTDPDVKAEAQDLVHLVSETADRLVADMQDLMVDGGIDKNRIDTLTRPMEIGMAKDILNKAEAGSFDAIVMGRQGPTPTKGCDIGTTAAKIVEHALSTPVWLVSGETPSLKILLAVDGSPASFHLVDHLAHVVGPNPDLELTLFHVPLHLKYCSTTIATGTPYDMAVQKPSLQRVLEDEDKRRMDFFYKKALEQFESAGIKKSQIQIKTRVWGHDVSSAILDEAKTGKHGTIIVARRGDRKAFFSGQIAIRLLHKVTEQSLWIVA